MRPDNVHPATRRAGLRRRLRDIVDRSIAMYVVRRLTGRPTQTGDGPSTPPILDADEVAYRIGATERRERRSVGARLGTPAQVSAGSAFARAGASSAAVRTSVRRRLIRDTALTVAGLVAVAMIVVAIWQPPRGGVLGETATPGPNVALALPVASDAGDAEALPPVPSATGSGAPTQGPSTASSQPRPEATATGGSISVSRPRSTARPRFGPTPSPRSPQTTFGPSVATPSPTAGVALTPFPTIAPVPTPIATPSPMPTPPPTPVATPTPEPTPTPTLDPTPTPMPDPTPTPTPEPTPTPTPEPTPTPTPEPTPDPTP